MKELNRTGLRKPLEELPVEKLQSMLQSELEKQEPDPGSVRLILRILEGKETEESQEPAPHRQAAWKRYRQRVKTLRRGSSSRHGWLLRAASVVLVMGLLFSVVPQQAEAETFWEMLQRWSGTVVEYFSGQDAFRDPEYSFKTDNPGLKQVYDAVVELGVTDPVVPMWLPDGFELSEQNIVKTPMLTGVYARFFDGDSAIVYKLDLYDGEPAHQYYKDDAYYESYERNGVTYNITRNNERWGVIWTKNNIECFLTLDCQEDTLRRILESIYVMGDN